MEPFARTIDAAKKYVVSSTPDRLDWNAERVDLRLVSRLEFGSGGGDAASAEKVASGLGSPALINLRSRTARAAASTSDRP